MTKVSELDLDNIGKVVRVRSEKIVGTEFSYGTDSIVLGTLESVTLSPDGEAVLKISGQYVYVKASVEVEFKGSEFTDRLVDAPRQAAHMAGQWLGRNNVTPPKS